MEVTFLGTGSGTPSRSRNVSALAVQLPERGEWWLLDCGEATQHQILRTPHLRLSQLTRIFITHLHGDHLFGLMGLLASRALSQGGASPVVVYGPSGLADYVRACLRTGGMRFGFPVEIVPVAPGIVCEDPEFIVSCAPVRHRMEAYAYAIAEKPRPGRFDAHAAAALGVPFGPLLGQLKAGVAVTLPDGRVISPAGLTGPTRPGRTLVFSGDTTFSPELVALSHDADLLIHEATYAECDRALAERAAHSTSVMAAQTARDAHVRRLFLTHFSARYESDTSPHLDDLLREARQIFPETYLAHDFLRVALFRRDEAESLP